MEKLKSSEGKTEALWGCSPIDEPYPYVQKKQLTGKEEPFSPDPLVACRWERPRAADGLEIFLRRPLRADTEQADSFIGIEKWITGEEPLVVQGEGTLRLDFGVELAGWLEIDSPDLAGEILLGVSEYNAPAYVNEGPQSPAKTARPKRYGDTYRLELNEELYEGVRFGFLHVRTCERPFHITAARLVCQTKPVNYNSCFHSDLPMLERIWYTAAYDVRVNLKRDYMAAILVDRGDRHSWTGDAYPTQAVSLTAFGNYDFVWQNMRYTAERGNGIESFELYWVLGLADYYEYTGDKDGVRALLPQAVKRAEHAQEIFDKEVDLAFFGWDERLGAGFEEPNLPGNRQSYRLLAIQIWKALAALLTSLGEEKEAQKYEAYAVRRTKELRQTPGFYRAYGLHTAADAINAGVLTEKEVEELAARHFTNRVHRLSFSPFNQYFILQAMARAGYYDEAIDAVLNLYGGQIEYGGTAFFENYCPDWNAAIGKNAPPPNSQCGYTSLAHPWGAGVLTWLSEEILGIRAQEPGFRSFVVRPHLGNRLRRIAGEQYTPQGVIAFSLDLEKCAAGLTVPGGTKGTLALPKAFLLKETEQGTESGEQSGRRILINGVLREPDGEDEAFFYFREMKAGMYAVTFPGKRREAEAEREADVAAASAECGYSYPARLLGVDRKTKGNWTGRYGASGYWLCGREEYRKLPDFVKGIVFRKGNPVQWDIAPEDERGLALPGGGRTLGALTTGDNRACWQTMTADIELAEERPYALSLYFADFREADGKQDAQTDDGPRALSVELFDGETRERIAPTQVLEAFEGGVYLRCEYRRSLRLRVNQIRGRNAVLCALFLDEFTSPATPCGIAEV